MREILFRGKRVDNDEWVNGVYLPKAKKINACIMWNEDDSIMPQMKAIDPETVGQFTGLTDKNGRKIFEGDIYEYNNMCWAVKLGEFYDTEVKENFYGWFCTGGNGECFGLTGRELAYINIIGNIHDNPELVGGDK